MVAYLDVAGFKNLTVMPSEAVDELELAHAGWLAAQLANRSKLIDAKLAKRYDVPFQSPYPEIVQGWLARIVTPLAMLRRGVDATDQQYVDIRDDARAAWEEIDEAANGEEGLYDLPLRADTDASGVTRGGPFGYSEASPYVWTDIQAETGRAEDRARGGTGD